MWRALVLSVFLLVTGCGAPAPQPWRTTDISGADFGRAMSGLSDHHGKPMALADFRGKVVVMYLGYTSCPDVCTISLSLIAQALAKLDAAALPRVQGLFVSVDPERDSPERLADYAPFFHPRILGASGSTAEIAQLARQYGSSYRLHPKDADGQYAVDHSSITYVIDADGKLVAMLPFGSAAADIAAAIEKALASRA